MDKKLDSFLEDFRVTVDNPEEHKIAEDISSAVYAKSKKESISQRDMGLFEEIFEPIRWEIFRDFEEETVFIQGVFEE